MRFNTDFDLLHESCCLSTYTFALVLSTILDESITVETSVHLFFLVETLVYLLFFLDLDIVILPFSLLQLFRLDAQYSILGKTGLEGVAIDIPG